jgi:serine/threonine protein kinase
MMPSPRHIHPGALQEAGIMVTLRHPNIVSFIGVTLSPPAVVMEFCALSSAADVLERARRDPAKAAELTWERRLAMATDAAQGMLYLHSRSPPVIHRDLKSPNLLVAADWSVRVSDFNMSKVLEGSERNSSIQAMNPRWLAPEVVTGAAGYGAAGDVFAFGVILWELLTWREPWGQTNPWGIVGKLAAGERLVVPPPADLPGPDRELAGLPRYLALMEACWAQDPAARPTFNQILLKLRVVSNVAGGRA